MLDSNVSTYIDKDGNVQEVGSGGVDASTLNGVITGANGITTALNAARDKVEVKTPYNLNSEVEQLSYGPYKQICEIERITGSIDGQTIVGGEFRFRDADSYYSFDGYHVSNSSTPTSKLLYADGPIGNVKTIGGQSIYGNGDIPVGSSEYANTSEIVDNAITLTSTSTLTDLATQILAQKTKVCRVSYGANTMDTLARLYELFNMSNAYGTPPYTCTYFFKVLSSDDYIELECLAAGYTAFFRGGIIQYERGDSEHPYGKWQAIPLIPYANPYSVGSIYISTSSTHPSSLLGGTWEQIKDVFLLAAGDTYTAGSTGGSANAVVVSHNHIENGTDGSSGISKIAIAKPFSEGYGVYYNPDGELISGKGEFLTTEDAGVDGTGKNMPPYLTVYMWKRIA